MIQPDKTVLRETGYISFWVCVLSLIMQAVFLLVGHWDYTVLLGNLWGGAVMVLNFFFMGLSVQKAVTKEEKEAKNIMKLSHTIRTLFIFIAVVMGVIFPFFSTLATIIPLFFPRFAIFLRAIGMNKQKQKEEIANHEAE